MTVKLKTPSNGSVSLTPQDTASDVVVTVPAGTSTVVTNATLPTQLNASGSAPIYACRAWVNFNGTGTVAIRASGNVSSITDLGVGLYLVNFSTAMPDVNYASSCTGGYQTSITTDSAFATSINKGISTFRLATRSGGNADQDQDSISVSIFR